MAKIASASSGGMKVDLDDGRGLVGQRPDVDVRPEPIAAQHLPRDLAQLLDGFIDLHL